MDFNNHIDLINKVTELLKEVHDNMHLILQALVPYSIAMLLATTMYFLMGGQMLVYWPEATVYLFPVLLIIVSISEITNDVLRVI